VAEAIDIAHLELYVGGDLALRDEILCIFADQAQDWLARLDPQTDDNGWRNAAHALKGAARGVGAWDLGNLCEAGERLVGPAPDKTERREALLAEVRSKTLKAIAFAAQLRDAGRR
jgi:HPt (histidine-containing phosphotransfer) domain-containing protein